MSGDIEYGRCEICGESASLTRKYYHYDIKCDCHHPNHFELVRHCSKCTPKPPFQTKVTFLKSSLQPIEE